MTPQVFISYSNENETDRQVADRIYDTLKAREIPCWAAHRDIAAGQNWLDEISKAISNSRVMIVVLSGFTEKSTYV
ncbi:MAG: toll/interleukin-1 receptor domain-containing protein, partial [Candidatus Aminicenantes bacterium]|nr:toll/interleukin-1 receptor domain-containing protein [Candidatus Aminicenantes bacterium]